MNTTSPPLVISEKSSRRRASRIPGTASSVPAHRLAIPDGTALVLFDIVALLHEISQAGRETIGSKPVTVMDVCSPHAVQVFSDPDRVRLIMMALMSNAAKFTDRGRIALIFNRDEDRMRLTVTDTGRGMRPEQISAIFESSDRGYDDEVYGQVRSGLGLRIVKALVALLGGNISVSSKLGEGTIVTVSLPLGPSGNTHNHGATTETAKPA